MLRGKKNDTKPTLFEREISVCTSDTLFIIGIICLVIFIAILIFSSVGTNIKDIFERTIGEFETALLGAVLGSVLLLSLVGFLGTFFLYLSTKKIVRIYRENFYLTLFAVIFCVIILLGGIFLIDSTISPQKIEWTLRDSKTNQDAGKVICYEINSGRKIIFVGDTVHCDFLMTQKSSYIFNSVDITYKNESSISRGGRDYQIEFEAPSDVKRLFFRIHTDIDNYKEAQIALEHTFMTPSQYEENKRTFLTYFLALIGLITFTVPQLIIHLREIATK